MVSKSNIYQEGNEILQLGEKFGTKNTISENKIKMFRKCSNCSMIEICL